MLRKKDKKNGSTLVVALLVLSTILISTLSMTLVVVRERKASIGSVGSSRAYQASEVGVEKVMQAITRGNYATIGDMVTGTGFTCANGMIDAIDYKVELLDSTNTQIACSNSSALVSTIAKIKSIGILANTKRAIEAKVSNKITKNLMHFNDNSDDSSFYVDGYTINNNNVTFSDSTPTAIDSTKYGVFSSGKYLTVEADNAETLDNWNFDDNDFTIEAWVKISSRPSGSRNYTMISRCNDSDNLGTCNFYFNIDSDSINFYYSSEKLGRIEPMSHSYTTTTNTWHHFVFERKGDVGYFFIDGTRHFAGNFGSGDKIKFDSDTANELRIGINHNISGVVNNDSQFIGSMDEIRITKGVARWTTTTFTPWDIEYAWND